MPSFPWSALFWVLSLALIGLAGYHAAMSTAILDRVAAAVLVPLGLLGLVIWSVAMRALLPRRRRPNP